MAKADVWVQFGGMLIRADLIQSMHWNYDHLVMKASGHRTDWSVSVEPGPGALGFFESEQDFKQAKAAYRARCASLDVGLLQAVATAAKAGGSQLVVLDLDPDVVAWCIQPLIPDGDGTDGAIREARGERP